MLSLAFYPTWIASSHGRKVIEDNRGVSLFGNSHRLPHVLKVFSKPMAAVDYFPFTQVLTVAHLEALLSENGQDVKLGCKKKLLWMTHSNFTIVVPSCG